MHTLPEIVAPDDEHYWSIIGAQYKVSEDFINLENGYFGIQATPVYEAYLRYQDQINRESSYFLRVKFDARVKTVMCALASFAGVEEGELLITRNPMEALNILIQGYPFNPGDEILLADHDYESVIETLEMVSARALLSLLHITIPIDPDSDEQIVAMYERAITSRTRVLLLTHVVHRTGQIMPVAKIAEMARRRGIDVIVDAAHSFAQLDYTFSDLGVDFIATSLHKWLGAPLGMGLLYIRKNRIADIAPFFGDVSSADNDIKKLGHFGTTPPAPILAVEDALDFQLRIGLNNKEKRLRYLTQYWLEQVRTLPNVHVFTPRASDRYCAIASLGIAGVTATALSAMLMEKYKIFTVVRQIGNRDGVRITPHLFTTIAHLDALVFAIKEIISHIN